MATPIPDVTQRSPRHLASDLDLEQDVLVYALDLAAQMKRSPARFSQTLSGRYLSLLFEKPSLRTRMTFELAMKQLGGDVGDRRRPRWLSANR